METSNPTPDAYPPGNLFGKQDQMPIQRIKALAGVPILYDREPDSNYGHTGYPLRPYVDAKFAAAADRAFQEMFLSLAAAGVGEVTSILTGGISRSGGGVGYHERKRAFDLDGLVFSDGQTWVANSFNTRRFEYLIIEAHLRRAFGTVLTYGYDQRFEDHIHFDNGDPIGFRKHSKSRTLFLQNALRYLFDQELECDGTYGPETQQAERAVRAELNLGALSIRDNWDHFLTASIEALEERLSMPAIVKAFS